jgi:hypothetical protein
MLAQQRSNKHLTKPKQPQSAMLRRRAESVINNSSIDPQWRPIIRYALEIMIRGADLVRRADAGERIVDSIDFTLEPETNEDDSTEEKIEVP